MAHFFEGGAARRGIALMAKTRLLVVVGRARAQRLDASSGGAGVWDEGSIRGNA